MGSAYYFKAGDILGYMVWWDDDDDDDSCPWRKPCFLLLVLVLYEVAIGLGGMLL